VQSGCHTADLQSHKTKEIRFFGDHSSREGNSLHKNLLWICSPVPFRLCTSLRAALGLEPTGVIIHSGYLQQVAISASLVPLTGVTLNPVIKVVPSRLGQLSVRDSTSFLICSPHSPEIEGNAVACLRAQPLVRWEANSCVSVVFS
jgi:hypothetical protein